MSILMSKAFIQRPIHSESRQGTVLMNGPLTRFVQKRGFVQKRNTAVCCSETQNSSGEASIGTIFHQAKSSKNSQYFV